MSLFDEKRKSVDRRVRNDGPPPGCRERRSKRDRRQTEISEISFHEWTRYLLRFKKRAAAKTIARQIPGKMDGEARKMSLLARSAQADAPQEEDAPSVQKKPTIPF
jgi:hypothetical protein